MWIIFSAIAALSESLKDVLGKKNLLKNLDEYLISWSFTFFGLLCLLPILFVKKIPSIGGDFWWVWIVDGLMNLAATILYFKAIKYSDISITVPMIAFTPIFLLLTSPIMLGEFPNIFGLIGILMIVVGSYALKIKEKKAGFFKPFKALITEKGPRTMLVVAFIWSITSNFDKIGVQNSSPVFWSAASGFFIASILFPVVLIRNRKAVSDISKNIKSLFPLGVFHGLVQFFQMTAVSLTLVSYVISIKRTSILLSVILGALIFKEKDTRERLAGAIIMFLGILLITLLG
jgi:drug/metabolite transporter (DMT)-like permease